MNYGYFFRLGSVLTAIALLLIFGGADSALAVGKGGGGKPPPQPPTANPVIVFKSGRDIVLADEDGGNRTVVHNGVVSLNAASWCSPDGTDIVFVDEINGKTGVYRLKVIHVDAVSGNRTVQVEQPELIAETNDLGLTRPACSPMPIGPDQKIKVIFRDREIEPDGSLSKYDNFYLTNLDGFGAPILLLDGLQRGGLAQFNPSWSPLGDRIVFSSAPWTSIAYDVEVVEFHWDSNTGDLIIDSIQSLIRGEPLTPLQSLDEFQPRWSNTSDQIAVAASSENGRHIWIVSDPDYPTVATQVPYDNDAVIRADVAWSPDDTQFIYLRNPRRGMCGEGDGLKVKGNVIAKSNVGGKDDRIGVCDEVAIIRGGNGWPDLAGRFPDWWRGAPGSE